MKLRTLILFYNAALFLPLGSCDQANQPTAAKPEAAQPAAAPAIAASRIESAKVAIEAEPAVKDLLVDQAAAVQWQVGVLDDGTPRFGYADYICQLLSEQGARDDHTVVRIVDVAKVGVGNFRAASLGTVACRDGTRLDDAPAARG